jgi:hypothetical protein
VGSGGQEGDTRRPFGATKQTTHQHNTMTTTERDTIIAACDADTDCSAFWAAQDAHFEVPMHAAYEARVAAFEDAYEAHIEEMCCPY